jgi:nitroimidazol reductase NimA-like FMN-containing flavoprotein (pyridoxamine 5'-phosphate oxidase superfamily)
MKKPKRSMPVFRDLRVAECRALLRRHHVGRIAFAFRDRVDIEPISYVMSGEWLYARTSPGTKLVKLAHNPWVAFEVDEIDGPFDWKSVVMRGTAYFLEGGARPSPEYTTAVRLLRKLDPRALTHEDAAPHRTVLFRIHVDALEGRAASTG